MRTLPTVFELLRGGVQLTRQLREVRVEDVLGRDPVVMELERVGAYLEDKIVMVTGAGGSVGAELCRQIARVRPKLLVLLDHAEDNLFRIDREMLDEWHFTRVEAVLADCKEAERMLEVMQRFKPDVVFHAAAYKHVPLMEANPLEAVRNNAIATRVTAQMAAVAGAERFVLISTDKAVNPRTVMGASKAMAEWIVGAAGHQHAQTRFVIVRFGNVLASSGSVVPIFRAQIEKGGPVTVTHPEMTRYFMTIPEAVQLVIQAGDLGSGSGDVFVLEMGDPVRILDLARNMINLAGYEPDEDVAIQFVGPAPWREDPRGALQRRRACAADDRRPHRPRRSRPPARPRLGGALDRAARGARRRRRRSGAGGSCGRGGHRANLRRLGCARASRRPPVRTFPASAAASPGSVSRPGPGSPGPKMRPALMHFIESIGPILGIVAFVGLATLAFLLFQQARDLRRLREWAGRAPERAQEAAEAVQAAGEASRGDGRGRRGGGRRRGGAPAGKAGRGLGAVDGQR